jgi:hypothetical protein
VRANWDVSVVSIFARLLIIYIYLDRLQTLLFRRTRQPANVGHAGTLPAE